MEMISVRTMSEEVVSNYEFLRQLKFMVGEWVDEDPDSVVESKVYFDEEKNFLIHDFNVRRGRSVVQKGTQRIGWDPQAKRIRGWVFDSQGGFGESSWEEVEGSLGRQSQRRLFGWRQRFGNPHHDSGRRSHPRPSQRSHCEGTAGS